MLKHKLLLKMHNLIRSAYSKIYITWPLAWNHYPFNDHRHLLLHVSQTVINAHYYAIQQTDGSYFTLLFLGIIAISLKINQHIRP